MRDILRDSLSAVRMIRARPGFVLTIVLTLALGIGSIASISSFVVGILLQPLDYPDAERLVEICETHAERDPSWCGASPGAARDWRRLSKLLEKQGLARHWSYSLERDGRLEAIRGGVASPGVFEVFGGRPTMGRFFREEDSDAEIARAAVISHDFWISKLGGEKNAMSEQLEIDGELREIVGILPAGFEIPDVEDVEVWLPIWASRADVRFWRGFRSFGRLVEGAGLADAQGELAAVAATWQESFPETNKGWSVKVESLHERTVRPVRTGLLVFVGAVMLVHVIGCANVANMLLTHAAARRQELAVRAALGAGRGRLFRILMTENAVLALVGGIVGVLLATWTVGALVAIAPSNVPRLEEVRVDGVVLVFSALISIVTICLFGMIPAWYASRPDLREGLKEAGRSTSASVGTRPRNLLVVSEIALALLLMIAAVTVLESFAELLDWHPGFEPDGLVVAQVFAPSSKYTDGAMVADLYSRLGDELSTLPGVVSVAAGSAVPLRGGDGAQEYFIDGLPVPADGEKPVADWFDVGPGYFETLRLPLLGGREFTVEDGGGAPRVAIVNETFARRHWPTGSAIGQKVHLEHHAGSFEIVGVVGDVQPLEPLASPAAQIFWPYRQFPRWAIMFALRPEGESSVTSESIKARIESVDPDTHVGRITTMAELLERQLIRPRFSAVLLAAFAFLAVAMAAVGTYGVISYLAEQRRHEFGIRLALGARRADLARLVGIRALVLTGTGSVIGIAVAIAVSYLLPTAVIEIPTTEASTMFLATLILGCAALIASWLPARRAARVDPMVALRGE